MQRVRHAYRGRLLLRTLGPVPLWDLHVFLCRDQSLLSLSSLRTFEFRTSLGTSLLLSWSNKNHPIGVVKRIVSLRYWLSVTKLENPVLQCYQSCLMYSLLFIITSFPLEYKRQIYGSYYVDVQRFFDVFHLRWNNSLWPKQNYDLCHKGELDLSVCDKNVTSLLDACLHTATKVTG